MTHDKKKINVPDYVPYGVIYGGWPVVFLAVTRVIYRNAQVVKRS